MGKVNPLNTNTERQCCVCKNVKPLVEFSRNKYLTLGYSYYCLLCKKLEGALKDKVESRSLQGYVEEKSKNCKICKSLKSIGDFYFSKNYPQSRCKECQKKYMSEWLKDNRNSRILTARAWRAKNWEHLKKKKREYYRKSLETESGRRCLERAQLRAKERRVKNPEISRFWSIKSRSKEEGMPFPVTKAEFLDWFLKAPKKCEYCDIVDFGFNSGEKYKTFTVDRKNSDLPYFLDNICLSCWTCNRLKNDYFSHTEFKEIAEKYIKPRWMEKLAGVKM